jgi:hypothetical protein
MLLSNILTIRFAAFAFTTLLAIYLTFRIWKTADPNWFKVLLTLIAFVPFFGPLFVFWIANFPDRMHPSMQAKYKNAVNSYSFPAKTDSEKAQFDSYIDLKKD